MSAVDIGSMGNLAPGPHPQPGKIVGLIPALHAASDIGAPLVAAALARRKWMKDYNDGKVSQTAGTSANGQVVRASPRAQAKQMHPASQNPSWMPEP